MLEYITKSAANLLFETISIHTVPVELIHSFNKDIDIKNIARRVEDLVPSHLLRNVDIIYVADVKDFHKDGRSFNAMYKDGAIYISPDQDDEADLLDDIIHEIAHSFEKEYFSEIYKDGDLEREFLAKRKTLYFLLDGPVIDMLYFKNPIYNFKFDEFMYNNIGYDKLRTLSSGLFYSPYAITSLREYWANGFENYLLGDRERLRELCPVLYAKITNVLNNEEI